MDMDLFCRLGGQRKSKNFELRLYEILKTKLYILEKPGAPEYLDLYFPLEELKLRTGLVRTVDDHLEEVINLYGMTSEALKAAGDMYSVWKDFRKRILDPSIVQINANTDLEVSYSTMTEGSNRRVAGITFRIRKNRTNAFVSLKESETIDDEPDGVKIVRSVIRENISASDCVQIYAQANGDINKIREAYSLAQNHTSTIKNLTAWMISAIKNGWKDSYVSQKNCDQEQPSQKKAKVFSKKNHEERFGFAANEYDFNALENELLETNEEDLINPSAHINQLNSDA